MGKYLISGGRRLNGYVNISGGKNSMLPILAASVLNANTSVIRNCPKLSDAFASQKILEAIGCRVHWENDSMIIDSKPADCCEIPEYLMREMRSSVIFLGSILARFEKAKISFPGGCDTLLGVLINVKLVGQNACNRSLPCAQIRIIT